MSRKPDSLSGLRVRITRDIILVTGKPHQHAGKCGTATTSTTATGRLYRVHLDSGETISVPRALLETEALQPLGNTAVWTNNRVPRRLVKFNESDNRRGPAQFDWTPKQPVLRPGANDHMQHPSLISGKRVEYWAAK